MITIKSNGVSSLATLSGLNASMNMYRRWCIENIGPKDWQWGFHNGNAEFMFSFDNPEDEVAFRLKFDV